MKKTLVSLLALLVLPWLSLANGDPVISYSANIRSCNPVPLKVAEVQVVREDLNIDVKLPYTHVRVAYNLRNSSAAPIHVDYGFPVDFSGKLGEKEGYSGNEWNESIHESGISGRAVRDVHFRLDGRELEWTRSDSIVKTGYTYEDINGETVEEELYRLWTYTVLDIPVGATVTLEVDYSVLNNWNLSLLNLMVSPLSRYFPSDLDFSYDFTPAQHWGNGKADVLSIRVDASGLPDKFTPTNSSVGANWLKQNGKVWTVTERDFDFASSGPLTGSFYRDYNNDEAEFPSWGDPLKNCAIPTSAYRLNVSASQDKYPASNLQDGDTATAWVATGDGVGSTIEIVFPQPRRVSDIALYNGYHKSSSLWSANSRIKRVRVEITRADGYEESWESRLDEEEEWWEGHSYTLYPSRIPRFGAVSLLNVTNISRMMDGREIGEDEDGIFLYKRVPEDLEKVSRIRMTVLEVVPGTKYKDLCLSELMLLDGFIILPE